MDPVSVAAPAAGAFAGAGIPAAIAAGGEVIGGIAQLLGQQSQAKAQMEFQERMSSTAYQRTVNDMRMAGLNPALAYPMGGASTPAGAQATIPNVIGPAVSSAMSAARLTNEMKLLQQQVASTNADALRKGIDAKTAELIQPATVAQSVAEARAASANAALVELASKREATKAGEFSFWLKRMSPLGNITPNISFPTNTFIK